MEKSSYRIELVPGTDEDAFLTTGDAAGLELRTNLNNFDNFVILKLTEAEAEELKKSTSVVMVEKCFAPEAFNYPHDITQMHKTFITGFDCSGLSSAGGRGTDYAGLHQHLISSRSEGLLPTYGDLGFFVWTGEQASIITQLQHKLIGRYVDIVAIEAGSGSSITSTYNSFESSRNYKEYDPQSYELTMTNNGSTSWLVTGTHRGGNLNNASNPTLQFRPGDKVVITNNADSSHPLQITTSLGVNQIGGQAPVRSRIPGNVNNTNGGSLTFYIDDYREVYETVGYSCANHGSMAGTISIVEPTNSRLVRMDWSQYDAAMNNPENDQINNSQFFGYHSLGVISAAAGAHTGYAKNSSIRIIYLDDVPEAAYNAVLNWHNSKPVNPETGVRNATITTGAWGYATLFFDRLVPVDTVSQVNRYTDDGTLVQTNRPGSSWGSDLSAFVDAGFTLRCARDQGSGTVNWMVVTREQYNRFGGLDTALDAYDNVEGLYHFRSAGNSAHTWAKRDSPQWDNNIVQDAGTRYTNINWNGGSCSLGSASPLGSNLTHYPLRVYDQGHPNEISIGAAQPSTNRPYPDSYSTRGPGIDFFAPGAMTYGSAPDVFSGIAYFGGATMADGDYYSYFSGTSCAAPVAAGVGACFVEEFFVKKGKYPTIEQLRQIMKKHARPVMSDSGEYNWSNIQSPSLSFTSTGLLGFVTPSNFPAPTSPRTVSDVHHHPSSSTRNDGFYAIDLFGSTNLLVGLPYGIDAGNNGKHVSTVRGPIGTPKARNTGLQYPRYRKKLFG